MVENVVQIRKHGIFFKGFFCIFFFSFKEEGVVLESWEGARGRETEPGVIRHAVSASTS